MTRVFIYLPSFEKQFKNTDLNKDDETAIENEILNNPATGVIIKGTGGIRKFRMALPHTGKSGGARVIYVDFPKYGKVYLIAIFAKNEKDNLNQEERNELKILTKMLELEAGKG